MWYISGRINTAIKCNIDSKKNTKQKNHTFVRKTMLEGKNTKIKIFKIHPNFKSDHKLLAYKRKPLYGSKT